MNRDDAVRVVARLLCPGELGPCDDCYQKAQPIVAALVAAGWGDLTAERERLAVVVEADPTIADEHGRPLRLGRICADIAARLIRTTTEEDDRG